DKMKLWFTRAHTEEHSFSVEGLREIVSCDVVKLGVLEQLLAATRVGIPLKAGYAADMKDKE
ncbi:hypothetical protein Tco_0188302, partial [Tanacetum coccineum]